MTSMAFGLDAKDAVRLKKAGVSDQTLDVMAKEKIIETAAFTVEEVLAMKAAGIGENTLQSILTEGSFLKDREPIVYGKDLRSVRFTTAADIIELKKAGGQDHPAWAGRLPMIERLARLRVDAVIRRRRLPG